MLHFKAGGETVHELTLSENVTPRVLELMLAYLYTDR